ncbi:MAG: glycosyltransferase family 2 protein [Proteobacteria bacterium]|nr:glycosyltransferase family 2 protein [Pseudomonadota bacterium]
MNSNDGFSVNHKNKQTGKPILKDQYYLSVVVPVHNEEGNLEELYDRIHESLEKISGPSEIIFVDDGSSDGSTCMLEKIAKQNDHVRLIIFRRNYGQTAALAAGFKYAKGKIIVPMDADLQNDPGDIPLLVGKIEEGADVVSGWRKDRKEDTLRRKIPSMIANKIINKLISGTGVSLHDYGCTLKAYRREVLQNIKLYGEMHRFIPAFAAWLGVRVDEVEVKHYQRSSGVSKYGLSRITRVLFDFVIVRFFADYMTKPIQFFGKIAIFCTSAGMALGGFLFLGLVWFDWNISFNSFLTIFLFTVILSVQCITIGLLGEIHIRNYFELLDKDPYVIRNIVEKQTDA